MKNNIAFSRTRTDYKRELENHEFSKIYDENGFEHNYWTPYSPQQIGVGGKESSSIRYSNWILVRENSYELFKEKKSNITFFRTFNCKRPIRGKSPI